MQSDASDTETWWLWLYRRPCLLAVLQAGQYIKQADDPRARDSTSGAFKI